MSRSTFSFVSWILTATAVALWAAVPLFLFEISHEKRAQDETARSSETQALKGNAAVLTHTLLETTGAQREKLTSALDIDVISIVDMIEKTGNDSGVNAEVSGAVADAPAKNDPLSSLSFSIHSTGSFDALMREASLLQTLPIASSLEEVRIEKAPVPDQWILTARLRVRTTASLSS